MKKFKHAQNAVMEKRFSVHHKIINLPKRFHPGFLANLDKRTEIYSQLAKDYENLLLDLGGEDCSYLQTVLAERAVFLVFTCRILEEYIAEHPRKCNLSMGKLVHANSSLTSLAKVLGLKRQAKKGVSLKSIIGKVG